METDKKFYIVSFGDSRKYRVSQKNYDMIGAVKNELTEALSKQFPGQNICYYIKPQILEVDPDQSKEYENYPELDANGIDEIRKTLATGIEVMDENFKLDANARFADI